MKKATILIVDDVAENVQILLKILSPCEYEFIVAMSGTETFEVLEFTTPNMILLDVMLPDTNGFDVCKKLKQNPNTEHIPVIFLTAKVEVEDKVKGFRVGAVDYITKPFENAEVLARVGTHLKLRQIESDLRQSNELKDLMFSIIAHDLRSPMSGLTSMLELLVDCPDCLSREQTDAMLRNLKDSASSVLNLLESLLYWARSQRNELNVSFEQFNLLEFVNETLSPLILNALQKQINLSVEIPAELQCKADKNMFKTVIRNLVSNAIKFTKVQGIITLTTKEIDRKIEIVVTDNGVGIGEENLQKIFNKAQVFSTYGTNNEKGAGLGLMLCKDFIEKHNGTISIESTPNVGTNICIQIPNN